MHAQSIDSQVLRRIRGHGKGWVFTPSHVVDLGSQTTETDKEIYCEQSAAQKGVAAVAIAFMIA